MTLTLPQGNGTDLAGNFPSITVSATIDYQPQDNPIHNADQNADNVISISELLRLIQFYNIGALHCEVGTEDGFAPGTGAVNCLPHASDYNPQDWRVSLSELLRAIQFYNILGYYRCEEDTEDGFCAGVPPLPV